MWCIDPWYCFGGRSTSAGKFGQEKFFTSILMVKNAIFLLFRKYDANLKVDPQKGKKRNGPKGCILGPKNSKMKILLFFKKSSGDIQIIFLSNFQNFGLKIDFFKQFRKLPELHIPVHYFRHRKYEVLGFLHVFLAWFTPRMGIFR